MASDSKKTAVAPAPKEADSPDPCNIPPTYKEISEQVSSSTEIGRLKLELKDVMDKNAQWQEYNSQREEYVRGLLEKHNYVANRLQHADSYIEILRSNPDKLKEEQRRHFDALLVQVRQQLQQSRDETMKIRAELDLTKNHSQKETEKLKKDVEHWRSLYEEQRELIARLSSECENERRRSTSSTQDNKEKKQEIKLLRSQVEVYTKHFQTEREEKEELRLEVRHLRKEIRKSREKFSPEKLSRVIRDPPRVDDSRDRSVRIIDHMKHSHPTSHKSSSGAHSRSLNIPKHGSGMEDSFKKMSIEEKENVTFRRRRGRSYDKQPMSTQNFPLEDDEDFDSHLQCPNCGKLYHINDHPLLLSHIDRCS